MKRILLIAMCLIICVGFTACNKDKEDNKEATTKDNIISGPFRMKCGNGYLTIGMKVEDAKSLGGEPKDYMEIASCAYDGMDMIYIYNGYELYANTIDGKDVLTRIVLTDDSAMLKEGLYIGGTLAQMENFYGKDYSEKEGLYTYIHEETYLQVGIKNDKIVSIEIYKK